MLFKMENKVMKLVSGVLALGWSISVLAGSVQVVDPNVSFQAVERIGQQIWASGTNGGVYTSPDNGNHWQKVSTPKDTHNLQFRDLQPLDDGSLLLMSAGEGGDSRVYRSDASGELWQLQMQGNKPETFYDCIHFVDSHTGWLYGDSDELGLFVLATTNGGENWQRETLPFEAQVGEGGFASSGTCLNQGDNQHLYIGTGNGPQSRVLIKDQDNWHSVLVPIAGGEAAGVFSVQQVGQWLYVFGGSLQNQDHPAKALRYNLTTQVWQSLPEVPVTGAIYGSALLTSGGKTKVLIASPQGVSLWSEGDEQWEILSSQNIWSLSCDNDFGCIGVGKDGIVETFTLVL
jgi:photosystem II stability/assembly factor-like uncharacterized protein